MSTTYLGSVSSSVSWRATSPLDFSATLASSPQSSFARQFSSTEVTKLFYKTYSVTSTPTVIDVTTGLTDAYGAALSFATVKHLYFWNKDATRHLSVGGGTNALINALPTLIGQTPTNGSTGSCVFLTTSITTSGSVKILNLTASSGTILVDVLIAGT